jgi:hypothetical protein
MEKTREFKQPGDRLNAICPYFTMFPVEYPLNILEAASPGDRVLDPFCGRGTTLYAARLKGLYALGIDSSPVATAISSAKLQNCTPEDILERCRLALKRPGRPPKIPAGMFWRRCYHTETLENICKLRSYFLLHENNLDHIDIALRALVLGAMHGPQNKGTPSYLSNQMPRTYATKPAAAVRFWKKHGQKPRRIDMLELVKRRAAWFFSDTATSLAGGRVIQADSRTFDRRLIRSEFNWVVTSPPYPGMRTYVADQWIRNWFLGGPESVDYQESQQLGSGTGVKFATDLASVWKRIDPVCASGAQIHIRIGSLPSLKDDPRQLTRDSVRSAQVRWRFVDARSAGAASRGRRQAHQFLSAPVKAIREYDIVFRKA